MLTVAEQGGRNALRQDTLSPTCHHSVDPFFYVQDPCGVLRTPDGDLAWPGLSYLET